ncbi:MAG: ABC transporter permease [Anaerolineae bacterium]|nr:ABC transporter permease [Anaerolineae bacterium]
MRILLTIAWNDLRLTLRDRGVLANMLIVSVVLTLIVGFANSMIGGGSGDISLLVDVIDEDDTTLSADYLAALREANADLVLCPMDNDNDDICDLNGDTLDEDLAVERLTAETSLALIEIPLGFASALDSGDDVIITFRANPDVGSPQYIVQAVQAVTQKFAGARVAARVGTDIIDEVEEIRFKDDADRAGYADAVYDRAGEIWAEEPITVNVVMTAGEETSSDDGWNGFGQSVPGMGSMYVMFSIFPALAVLIQERRIWTLQRLVTSPISKAQILGGKVLARMAIGMIQYGIIFAVGAIIGISYGSDIPAIVVVMLAFVAAVTALTLAVSTFLKTEGQAGSVATFLSMTLAPLGGAWWPLMIVPDWMKVAGHISPVAWAMDAYAELMFYGGSMSTVLVPVAVLLGMAAVFFAFGAARFRYE